MVKYVRAFQDQLGNRDTLHLLRSMFVVRRSPHTWSNQNRIFKAYFYSTNANSSRYSSTKSCPHSSDNNSSNSIIYTNTNSFINSSTSIPYSRTTTNSNPSLHTTHFSSTHFCTILRPLGNFVSFLPFLSTSHHHLTPSISTTTSEVLTSLGGFC
jgi:hypothetical protein